QKWHDMYGEWDFDSVWYVGANTINLQCFYGNFIVKLANNLNNDVLEATSTLQSSYRYGESVSLSFKFKTGMDKYYNLSGLQLDGAQIAGINENTDGSYRFTGANEKFYSISNNAEEKSFSITINSVNLSTKGEYGIDVPEKKFTISITSKLFVEDEGGELQVVEGETPAYVYYASSTSSEVYRLQIVDKEIKYGRPEPYAFGTIEKDNSPIKFDGWFIEKEGGDTRLTGGNVQILSFDFGVPFEDDVLKVISDNCSIYARYVENACRLTFDMDEGVAKVELFAGEKVITDSTQFADVSKTGEKIRLDIYILKDFAFDVELFIENLGIYKTESNELVFCELIEEPFSESGLTHYKFHINMNALNSADFEETFNIKIQTEEEKKEDKTWIWIVAGAGGGVVLIVLIIVIVVVAKRRGGGGRASRGGGSFKKKNVKGMYF
ncbi:MAG: hypothetical protein J6J24_02450, partial [Clostridia bacterium]|nr:hypothetical protein [Clostridia bacterium]